MTSSTAMKARVLAPFEANALVSGLEYGYHALFTGWIDTLHENYPCRERR